MRSIKFRAWDLNNEAMFTYEDMGDVYFGLCNDGSMELIDCAGEVNTPLQAVFMQYTGLKDKNGVEIYEGDILEAEGIIYRIEWIQEYLQFCIFTQQHWVWFQEGSNHFKYCHQYDSDGRVYFLQQLESYEITVIGNIHQNPELLEGDS